MPFHSLLAIMDLAGEKERERRVRRQKEKKLLYTWRFCNGKKSSLHLTQKNGHMSMDRCQHDDHQNKVCIFKLQTKA